MTRKFTTDSYSRRKVLRYTGAASAVGLTSLAGCTGGDGNGNGGNGNGGNGGNGNGNGGNGNGDGSDYPSEDIRYIIPFSEGGGTDTYARQMVPLIDERLDVNIAIENISGAASLRGTGEMMLSEPDGYTIGAFNPPSTPVSEMVNPQDSFDLQEVVGVASYARTPFVIVANPDHEIEGYEDLLSRYDEGELEIFSGKERGGVDHVMAILMQNLHGFEWDRYVGYDGTGPAVQATISGEVPACIATDTGAEAGVESGDLDLVTGLVSNGTSVFPDAETITDLGYENIDFISQLQRGIYAPPGTPEDRLEVIESVVEEVTQTEEMQQWSEETGNIVEFGSGEQAEQAVRDAYEIIPENVDLEAIREEAN